MVPPVLRRHPEPLNPTPFDESEHSERRLIGDFRQYTTHPSCGAVTTLPDAYEYRSTLTAGDVRRRVHFSFVCRLYKVWREECNASEEYRGPDNHDQKDSGNDLVKPKVPREMLLLLLLRRRYEIIR